MTMIAVRPERLWDRCIPGLDLTAVKSTLENDSAEIKIIDSKNAQ